MPDFKLGLVFKTPDPKEPRFKVPNRFLATLPPSVDISDGLGPYLDQADLGACGPNSAAECINFDQKVEGMPVVPVSRLFIYYNSRLLMGTVNEDSGVDNKTMLAAINQYGFPPETDDPYQTSAFRQKPSPKAYSDALPESITDYKAVNQDLNEMKGILVARRPFIFGFSVFAQIMSNEAAQTGIIADPAGASIGGHDMTCCGFNDSGADLPGVKPGNRWPNRTIKLRQHWTNGDGSPWGDGGYGYVSFDYALSPQNAGDFWTINTIPQGGTPVPPSPPAPPSPSPCRPFHRAVTAAIRELEKDRPGACQNLTQLVNLLAAMCGGIPLG